MLDIPKFDLSKAPHPTLVSSLLLFAPGLFFEVAIFLANPNLVHHAYKALALPAKPSLYLATLLAMFVAFLLGGLGETWAVTIRIMLRYIYNRLHLSRKRLTIRVRRKAASRPTSGLGRLEGRLLSWLTRLDTRRNVGVIAGRQMWAELAKSLLKRRFGVTLDGPLPAIDSGAWYELLGWPGTPDLRVSSFQKAFHLIGWYGVIALRFAPSLRDPYFLAPCLFLILNGVYQEWMATKRFCHPSWRMGSHIISIMSEFPPLKIVRDDGLTGGEPEEDEPSE
jgi:hypothetical protein